MLSKVSCNSSLWTQNIISELSVIGCIHFTSITSYRCTNQKFREDFFTVLIHLLKIRTFLITKTCYYYVLLLNFFFIIVSNSVFITNYPHYRIRWYKSINNEIPILVIDYSHTVLHCHMNKSSLCVLIRFNFILFYR